VAENVIAQAAVRLVADSSQLGAGITSALGGLHGPLGKVMAAGESSAAGIGGAFSKAGGMVAAGMAVAGVAAIGFAIKSADTFKNVGMETLKLQRYTGGTAESMSKLRFAAQQSGVDTDKLAKSLGFLSKNVASGKVNFDQYGIATLDAHGKTLPLNDILMNVAAKFEHMPNGVDKTAEAIKIFGKAGADMIPMLNKGKDGLMALESQAQKYGLVLTAQNIVAVKAATAAHREQTAAMQGLQVQIGANVLPVMTRLTKAFTEGLISVMPTVTGIMNATVIPAFSAFATVISTGAQFVEQHAGLVKGLAVVVGAFLVPALGLWLAEQVALAGSGFLMFLSNTAGSVMQVAAKMGLMTEATGLSSAAMTGFGIAATGGVAIIALLVASFLQSKAAAKAWADEAVKGATSTQDAFDKLTKAASQVKATDAYKSDWNGVFGFVGAGLKGLLDQHNKVDAAAAKHAQILKDLADAAKAQQTTEVTAGAAIDESLTKQGLTMEALGGATKLTTDQIDQLAASMKINLEKATSVQIESMTAMAGRLSVTAEHTLKLRDANAILSDFTQDATKKTAAFKSALDALIGTETSAEGTTIAWRQTLDDTVKALVVMKYSADLTTQSGRDYQSQVLKSVEATKKMIEEDQTRLGQGPELQKLEAQHVADLDATWKKAGMTAGQIAALNAQYNLTPAALNTVVTLDTSQATSALSALQVQLGGLYTQEMQVAGATAASIAEANARALATQGRNLAGQTASQVAQTAGGLGGGHRAAGGPVAANIPYLIGEEGPEVMTFAGAGTITPNSALTGGGGTTYVTNVNVNVYPQGSVITQGQLVHDIRTAVNTYNARSGAGR